MGNYSQIFLWVALFIIFVIGEVISLGLTSIWFAGGALAGFITSLITDVFWIQFAVFAIVSVVLIIFTRPIAKKHFNSKNLTQTNVDAMVGKVALVKEKIDNVAGTGVVSVGGLEWTARSINDGNAIEVETRVIIKEVKGVTVIVEAE